LKLQYSVHPLLGACLDPAIFVIDLHDASKKPFFKIFSAYYFLKVHLNHFSNIKSQKESQNSRNQGFFCYFCTMIEGSGRPKNMWIRIMIRIRYTADQPADPWQKVVSTLGSNSSRARAVHEV
jgi:hypothetical protein